MRLPQQTTLLAPTGAATLPNTMSKGRKTQREQMLATLRAFYRRHRRVPTSGELGQRSNRPRDYSLPGYWQLVRRFGSLRAALEAAKLPYRGQGYRVIATERKPRAPHIPRTPRPKPKHPVPILGADFRRVLDEAKAELARQDRLAVRFYVQGRSDLEISLSSLVRPRRRFA